MKSISVSRRSGFTLVELLIVIVVIAILATVSVVAYNGIQVRARNTARLAAAQVIYKQLEMYTRQTGEGFGAHIFCIPTEANCDAGNGGLPDCYQSDTPRIENAVVNKNFLDQNLSFSYPSTPISRPNGVTHYGIYVSYDSNLGQGMNGVLRPYILVFYLEGTDQDCGANSVKREASKLVDDPLNSIVSARNSYNRNGMTVCYLSLTNHSTV